MNRAEPNWGQRRRKSFGRKRDWAGILLLGAWTVAVHAQTPAVEYVNPSQANPNVHAYDTPNVVMTKGVSAAPLAIFMPGTGGRPQNVLRLLHVIAQQGYPVIGLSYNDAPSLSKVCPRDPDPNCSAKFREARTYGDSLGPVQNSQAESIVARLTDLLVFLDRAHPQSGWHAYLNSDGTPAWERIVVSGFSQGAGMAAYIAKRHPVARVVLFSSPWDTTGRSARPAPWLSTRSATPPDRWWAERHLRERTTKLIANAYAALQIPSDHILLLQGDVKNDGLGSSENPYHSSTVRNPEYIDQWRQLYGTVVANAGGAKQ